MAFLGNQCEGARGVVAFNGGYPNPKQSVWCGKLTVAGNHYHEMPGQGSGCMLENSTESMCSAYRPPPGVIGKQCDSKESAVPPACIDSKLFDECRATPGIAAICYNDSVTSVVVGKVMCVNASDFASSGTRLCQGFQKKCTLM